MRVLLDENLPHQLRRFFVDEIEAVIVRYRGWNGKENGELLTLAAREFDVFITTDQGIPKQQNLENFEIGIITQVGSYVAQSARLCHKGRKLAVYATNIG